MEKKKSGGAGVAILIVCGIITLALIVGCVFFPDQLFGMFK